MVLRRVQHRELLVFRWSFARLVSRKPYRPQALNGNKYASYLRLGVRGIEGLVQNFKLRNSKPYGFRAEGFGFKSPLPNLVAAGTTPKLPNSQPQSPAKP